MKEYHYGCQVLVILYKGHFIQHCPTNEDKAFDIARIRKPSGIPRDFLVQVQEPDVNTNTGMLVTPEGYYVKAQPQVQEWKRNKFVGSNLSEIPSDLKCSICNNLFTNPLITNCHHVFCEGCISTNTECFECKFYNIFLNISKQYKGRISTRSISFLSNSSFRSKLSLNLNLSKKSTS